MTGAGAPRDAGDDDRPLPLRADVIVAAARLRGKVVRTPVVRSRALDELAGCELWLKAENLQHIGAFKARGAQNAALALPDDVRRRGLVTYSSGNHAQAVALAARVAGVPADVFMPVDAPAVKLAVVRALGANVTLVGMTSTERRAAAIARQVETGGAMIEPFDDGHTIAGQGTATLELLDEVAAHGGALDALIVPVGGGGLVAGACLAAEGSALRIVGVEPVGCDSMGQSLRAGRVVPVPPGPTLADGLRPTAVGALNFAIARTHLAGCETVDDREIGRAVAALAMRAKLVVEPSGAAGLALAMRGLPGRPRRVGVILSGGNIAPERLAELVVRHAADV